MSRFAITILARLTQELYRATTTIYLFFFSPATRALTENTRSRGALFYSVIAARGDKMLDK